MQIQVFHGHVSKFHTDTDTVSCDLTEHQYIMYRISSALQILSRSIITSELKDDVSQMLMNVAQIHNSNAECFKSFNLMFN